MEEKATESKRFCGKADGFLLLYKRLEGDRFSWPKDEAEVMELTPQQYRWLMEGLSIHQKKTISKIEGKTIL